MKNQITLTVNVDVDELLSIINQNAVNAAQNNPPPKEEETILKRKDVSKMLGVSLVTIAKWMNTGKLPYHRINSRIFFKKSEVWAAMEINPKYRRAGK